VRARLQREVDNLEPNQLLNTAPADLAAYLVDKYGINLIDLQRDAWIADESECRVDVSGDREQFFLEERRGPYYIPGQRIRVVVPFDGDSELFYCRPSTFTSAAACKTGAAGELGHTSENEVGRKKTAARSISSA
jgi:hypothetical protein